jgi:hypothetical protein
MTLDPNFYQRGGSTQAIVPADFSAQAPVLTGDASIDTIKRLSASLSAKRGEYDRLDSYYNGEHGLRFASMDFKLAFAQRFGKYAENFCGVVVDAVEERLDVEGFRFPGQDEKDPDAADPDAWQIWQDNQLDAASQIAHTEALVKGIVYVLVGQYERIAGRSPAITVEDPCEAIVEYAPGSNERTVGMKRWDDPGVQRSYATLYYPDRIEKWQTVVRSGANQYGAWAVAETDRWEKRTVDGEPWPITNKLGVVPLVALVNRPRLRGEGRSEIADIIPVQDAINKLATDELVTSDTSSFPQKWATGIEIPVDPETGKSVEPWRTAVDRFMSTSVENAKFGQFEAATLDGYISAIEQKIRAIISISGTPFHYFMQHGGQPPSGQSLRGSETRLVRKARRKQRHFGEGWEEVMRLAFKALGSPKADVLDNETKWADPESLTESEHIDALTKKRAGLQVPLKQLWEDAGYSPTQREAFLPLLADEKTWVPLDPNAPPVDTAPPADTAPPPDFAALGAWLIEALTALARGMAPTVQVAPAQTTIGPGAVQVHVEAPAPPAAPVVNVPQPGPRKLIRDAGGRLVGIE